VALSRLYAHQIDCDHFPLYPRERGNVRPGNLPVMRSLTQKPGTLKFDASSNVVKPARRARLPARWFLCMPANSMPLQGDEEWNAQTFRALRKCIHHRSRNGRDDGSITPAAASFCLR
jgi:hypothetical protein